MSGPVRYIASGGQWRALTGAALNTTPPSPPSIISANYANDTLSVVVGPPLSNGGSAVTSYTVLATPVGGGVTQKGTSATSAVQVDSLVIGLSYVVSAFATNGVGDGTQVTGPTVNVPMKTYAKPLAYNSGYPHGLPGDTRTPAILVPINGDDFETVIQDAGGGVTITGYEVTGAFNLRRDNITFQSCRFVGVPSTTANGGQPMIAAGGAPTASVVSFIDCEFFGNGVTQQDPGGDLTLGWAHSEPCNLRYQHHLRSDISGTIDGFHESDNGRFESCYVHDLISYYGPGGPTHNDGFQFVGSFENLTIIGCNIDLANVWGLSSLFQYNDATAPGWLRLRVSIVSNWFIGGGFYVISGKPILANEDMSMVMAYNRFGLNSGASQIWYPENGWYDSVQAGRLTLISNVWDASGTTTYGQVVTEGELIPNPIHY